ncbi:MAG: FdtA/QdtA family cupin domain-containing protein, partial [Muribaculaceae bacterium]|nr:FdtA/QdtA family cupin domain-containing protein [Muribaculaceae bacterium]
EDREGHAYNRGCEVIVALSGSFDVVTDDGISTLRHSLNRSYYGLYVPAGVWRTLTNFSTNSLALILSSTEYDPDDYIIDHNQFLKLKRK